MSQRPIYLVVFNNRLFAAHWALWIPSFDAEADAPGNIGKLIHVEGDPRNGFTHEFKRNYNMSLTRREKVVIFLGWTNSENVTDGANTGDIVCDTIATDVIEEWALYIAAPGPSLRSTTSANTGTRVSLQNCQTWLRQLIQALIENEILEAEALEEIDRAPKN